MPHAYRTSDLMARAKVIDLTQHESVEVVSMGDLHGGDNYADIGLLQSACSWLAEKPNRYAVVPGDVFNTAIQGSVSLDLSEQNMTNKDARHLLARIMEPVKDRFLAIIPGNHDDRLTRTSGSDEVDALVCQLGIPSVYFPDGEAFIRVKVGKWAHNDSPVCYDLYMTHGTAGGRLPGGKANGLIAMRNIVHNADVYFNGHGHTPLLIPEVAWQFDKQGNVREQKQWFLSCGATLKRGGYATKKAYPPLARVFPCVELHGDGHKHMTVHAEH